MAQEFFIEKTIQKAIEEKKADFDGTDEEFEKLINSKLPKIIEGLLENLWDELYEYSFDENNDLRNHQRKINEKISKKYGNGIKLVESFIEMNSQVSTATYDKYYSIYDNYEDQLKLDTLISIHARACQIANEIRVLVTNGYADGAMSRWRTLHELCITFLFLFDNNPKITKMYNDYHVIERWKKANEFQENHTFLQIEPISKNDMEFIESERKEVLEEYGKEFGKSYGWTMDILPNGRRNIREMEKIVGLEHHRPLYTWASENVHSGVSGINKKLGLREEEQNNLLTGANDFGFTEPIEFMTISLTTLTETLLDMEDSSMNRIFKEFIRALQKATVTEFSNLE